MDTDIKKENTRLLFYLPQNMYFQIAANTRTEYNQ